MSDIQIHKTGDDDAHDFEIIDLRVDYASTQRQLLHAGDRSTEDLRKHTRALVHTIASKLGHTALRQGDTVECSKCGASGTATALLNGDVFWQPCGLPIDGGFAPFGKEKTPEHCERRARYERGCMRELASRGAVGDAEIASGHEKAALAYDARARELRAVIAPLHCVKVSQAVAAAIEIDNLGELKSRVHVKRGKGRTASYSVVGTLDDLYAFADHCERHSGFDMSPSTIAACNKAAQRIKTFIAETRAGKDLP